jgi:virulence-associated protein VagC
MRTVKASVSHKGRVINLPDEYKFEQEHQVSVRKVGREIIISPVITSWQPLLKFIQSLPDDLAFGKNKPDLSNKGNLF